MSCTVCVFPYAIICTSGPPWVHEHVLTLSINLKKFRPLKEIFWLAYHIFVNKYVTPWNVYLYLLLCVCAHHHLAVGWMGPCVRQLPHVELPQILHDFMHQITTHNFLKGSLKYVSTKTTLTFSQKKVRNKI